LTENESKPSEKGKASVRTPNDQRSDVYNKTSEEYKAAMDNRSRQIAANKAKK
jgi:hypothetical protein